MLSFSPDGKTLASGSSDYSVRLWDLATGQELLRTDESLVGLLSVVLAPDGKTVAMNCIDGTVRIWDLISSRQCRILPAQEDVATCMTLVPNSTTVVVGYRDGLVCVWDDPHFTVRDAARRKLQRLGPAAARSLRAALAEKPPLEVRRSLEMLLQELDPAPFQLASEQRLQIRSVHVLEQIGSANAQQLLVSLSAGSPDAWRVTRYWGGVRRRQETGAERGGRLFLPPLAEWNILNGNETN